MKSSYTIVVSFLLFDYSTTVNCQACRYAPASRSCLLSSYVFPCILQKKIARLNYALLMMAQVCLEVCLVPRSFLPFPLLFLTFTALTLRALRTLCLHLPPGTQSSIEQLRLVLYFLVFFDVPLWYCLSLVPRWPESVDDNAQCTTRGFALFFPDFFLKTASQKNWTNLEKNKEKQKFKDSKRRERAEAVWSAFTFNRFQHFNRTQQKISIPSCCLFVLEYLCAKRGTFG